MQDAAIPLPAGFALASPIALCAGQRWSQDCQGQ
jgi:hypothetical protein